MENLVPKKYHSLIKFTKLILNTDRDVSYNDISLVKDIIQNKLDSGMSPKDIQNFYNLKYSDFGMFLKKSLGLTLKSNKEAVNNYYIKIGKSITEEKLLYKKLCEFTFDIHQYPDIPNYNLLLELGIYHPIHNKNGVCRDHIVSKEYGFRNGVDPTIISHPANCQFLTNYDNIKKGESCFLNLDQLMERIEKWNTSKEFNFVSIHKTLPKTENHKKKISITNSKYMNITNGKINKRIIKTDIIPNGFYRGMTRKKW